jgi:hypothetical protein
MQLLTGVQISTFTELWLGETAVSRNVPVCSNGCGVSEDRFTRPIDLRETVERRSSCRVLECGMLDLMKAVRLATWARMYC